MNTRALIIPLFLIMVLSLSILMNAAQDRPVTHSFDAACCTAERDYAENNLDIIKAEGSTIDPRITILRHDINTDGKTDFLAKLEASHHCGSAGCAVHLFMAKDDEGYTHSPLFNTAANDFTFTARPNSAHADISFLNGAGETCTWSWAEGQYAFKDCDTP